MNVLVTGANGQLGNAMRIVTANAQEDNYIFTDIAELDITDAHAVMQMVRDDDIKVIVNCAAYTNVDKAEDEEPFAEMLNATAVGNLAKAIKFNDGILIHISSDYVFGDSQGNTPRNEYETTNPTGAYSRTKLHGEQAIKASGCRAIIIRTSWLYSEFGNNFVKTMLDLTAAKPHIKVVFDQVGTPTYAPDLAAAICKIIADRTFDGKEGCYHYSNEGVCSWFDFAKMIAEYAGHTRCDIRPCHSSDFPSKVTRPAYSVLDKTKIKGAFGIKIPYWTDSLKKCIQNLSKQ